MTTHQRVSRVYAWTADERRMDFDFDKNVLTFKWWESFIKLHSL